MTHGTVIIRGQSTPPHELANSCVEDGKTFSFRPVLHIIQEVNSLLGPFKIKNQRLVLNYQFLGACQIWGRGRINIISLSLGLLVKEAKLGKMRA